MAYNPETKYAYYTRGRNLALVEYHRGEWKSPQSQVVDGLMMEFTTLPIIPASETDDLDVTDILGQALIAYIKAMISDMQGDLDRKEYYYKEFIKWVDLDSQNKQKSVRKIIPSFTSSII